MPLVSRSLSCTATHSRAGTCSSPATWKTGATLGPSSSCGPSRPLGPSVVTAQHRDGEELAPSSQNLTLTSIGRWDEANYSCVAVNTIGQTESEAFTLEVIGNSHTY